MSLRIKVHIHCATPNLFDLKEEGILSSQGFSENNKITEEHSEESDNNYLHDNDSIGLLTDTPTAARKSTRIYHQGMAKTEIDEQGQTTNNKELLEKNRADYFLFHHIKDKLFHNKPVQQQAPVVNVYQTVSQQPALPVGHTVVHPPATNRETDRQREIEIVSAIRNDRLRQRPWHGP